jgi:type I restriction enzyme, R subunit
MSQFSFLKSEFMHVFNHAQRAEQMALSDPRGACFYARLALETAIKWMYQADKDLHAPYNSTLAAMIHEGSFRSVVGPALVTKARIIKDFGNAAVHSTKPVAEKAATSAVGELFHFCYWLMRTYAGGVKPPPGLQFDPSQLEKAITVSASTVQQIKELRAAADAREKAYCAERDERLKAEESRVALETEIKRLQAEVMAAKAANEAAPDSHDYNEAQTRDLFIDLLLTEAGWALDQERDREYPVTGMPSTSGQGYVDYVLWGDDGKPLAVVEAKRTKIDALTGRQQAKLYADCLEAQFGRRPVIFYTNGYEHWIWDDLFYPPRPIQGFLKKADLVLLMQRRGNRKPLVSVPIDEKIVERFYQKRAIRRVDEAFEKDHQRKVLLVMATGAGKTRTVIALLDQLMRANWAKRVLFLADRIALVKQAHNAFKTHLPSAPSANLLEKHDTKLNDHNGARVCLSTYPTMMGLINEMDNGARRYGTGHFDVIVIDEAHRSVYRKYRAIFDHFDCLLIGLTATPRDEIDRDTYSLFEIQKGVPTDQYDLDDAVSAGHLVPMEAVSVPLKFQREGIKYDDLSEEEKDEWDAIEWAEDIFAPPPDKVEAAAVNKWLFNEDTVDKVLQYLMTHGLKVEGGDRLGKTIIFAKNSAHANFIIQRFDANYPHHAGQFARVIDYNVKYAQSLIDDFSDNDKTPHIAASVDMLDTGIDIPEIVNLVFFKIVRSKTKFMQMIGRGTRLCPNLFGPGEHKTKFLVFDFCQNLEFFQQNPNRSDGALAQSIGERLFKARVDLIGGLDTTLPPMGLSEDPQPFIGLDQEDEPLVETDRDLRNALTIHLHRQVLSITLDNFVVRPKRRYVEKFQDETVWVKLSPEDREELQQHIAELPDGMPDEELEAKQFDLLLLTTQLAVLNADPVFTALKERIQKIASALEELANIPMVQAQIILIEELQSEDYWTDISLPMLEQIRRRLRKLVKLIDPASRKPVFTDFEDEIGEGVAITLPDIGTNADKALFMQKVRHFLKQHGDHITLQKVKRNEQLTKQDLEELERIFKEEGVAADEELEKIRSEGGLGLFLRSLVGLDREAAKAALDSFMNGKTLTANQIEFIDLIIDHLTDRGIINPNILYESPFTDLDDQGVSGVFEMAQVKELLSVLNDLVRRVAA